MKIQHSLYFGFGLLGLSFLDAQPAFAVGEAVNGFPNWAERVIHQWMNRARSEPQVEMTQCATMHGASRCGEAACYSALAPLVYNEKLNRAARFHSDEMRLQSYFSHDSACAVPSNIDMLYPTSCQGAASCACTSGAATAWNARVQLFGINTSGEIIASGTDPNGAFYQWLFEPSSSATCAYSSANGHRWNILKLTGSIGNGVSGPAVGDFASGNVTIPKIPSGSHYPRQSASVAVWANWYDSAAPMSAMVNVGGTCQPMTRQRGSDQNGAWSATVTSAATGCHRYYFLFQDSSGQTVTYPTTGSLAIGPAASCPDYDPSRPAAGAGCSVMLPEDPGPGPDPDPGPNPDPGTDPGGMASGCNVGGWAGSGSGAALPLLLSLLGLGLRRRRRV
jgi:hypothetical protein